MEVPVRPTEGITPYARGRPVRRPGHLPGATGHRRRDYGCQDQPRRKEQTALHAAAYSGSVPAVRLLLDRGADIEARDTNWNSTPIDWAAVGSGEQPADNPHPDWTAAAAALLEAGASTEEITLSPDDPKPPSPEVAALLRRHGEPAQHTAHVGPECRLLHRGDAHHR